MLDVGFSELLVFGIIALLVLGPEKLPEAARFAAKWYSKFKRVISNVQNDIDRELRLSEFREQMQQEMQRIQELEKKMEAQMQELKQQKIIAEQEALAAKKQQKSIHNYHYLDTSMPPIYQLTDWLQHQNCTRPTLRIVPIETNTPELKVAV